MGRIPLGEEPQSDRIHMWKRRSKLDLQGKPTRRRPFGYYSILGVAPQATALQIRRAYEAKAHFFKSKYSKKESSQSKSALTKQSNELQAAYEVLQCKVRRAAYDLITFKRQMVNSTLRSMVHRATISRDERRVEHSLDVARKRLDNTKLSRRAPVDPQNRRRRCTKRVSIRSTVIRPTDHWIVLKRGAEERQRDRRLGAYVAVPHSQILK